MAIGYLCPCCGERLAPPDIQKKTEQPPDMSGGDDDDSSLMICQPCGANPKASAPDMSVHTIPIETPIVHLDAKQAFTLLTKKEKNYAYWLSQADWAGAKICLLQCSVESPVIFSLLQLVFSSTPKLADHAQAALDHGLTQSQVDQAFMYAAAFYGNMGNYKSFGDSKFVPMLDPEAMYTFLTASAAAATKESIDKLWNECADRMYSLTPRQRQMGLGTEKGISTYFSANCDADDAKLANAFLDSQQVSAYNTRLFKDAEGNYTVRQASALDTKEPVTTTQYKGKTFAIVQGDYAPLMKRIADALVNALPYTANPTQTKMIEAYIDSFRSGSIDAHKDASRHWIRDKGPAVESYIGFIESYRDPSGVRGEWEGFCACVNKEVSRKFQVLVDRAESFLTKMPWPKEFEKDTFLRPDFTSLDVLSFGSSGVPAGINIPNYDDIRQSEGFKNVSLGNVLTASYSVAGDQRISFVKDADQELYKTLKSHAFEVQVGIHELLGHGSGKLYHQNTDDAKALLSEKVINPLTQAPITGPFYAPGATWGSTFASLAPSYEECRAECSGLYLCLESSVLEVFGVQHKDDGSGAISDVTYVNWLLMVRAGLTGLEFFTTSTKQWRQAHMNARYVILRLLMQTGEDFLKLEQITNPEDGKPDVQISLNRYLIPTVGKKVVGDFLLKLQVYKSLGDVENGSKLYNDLSVVPEDMLELRSIVMARKEPRKLLIQPYLKQPENKDVELVNFPLTTFGMVESFVARFPAQDPELMELYETDKEAMTD
jgi:dipeptidyl-peptidase-3